MLSSSGFGLTIGAYLRVSTDEQAREGFSIGAQKDRLLAFCHAQGWNVADIYVDEGVSGTKLDRPALSRLRRDAKAGKFNLVLVWKVDRLSRKVAHLAALVEELDQAGVSFRPRVYEFPRLVREGAADLGLDWSACDRILGRAMQVQFVDAGQHVLSGVCFCRDSALQ